MPLRPAAFLAIAVLFAPAAALAAHGKVGLWTSTTTTTLPGGSPQSHTATFCMTAAQVASDAPAAEGNSGCSYTNVAVHGHTFTADMICTGQFKASGHFTSTYDSDTHYTATVSIVGENFNMTNQIDGKWLRPDCTGAAH